MAQPQRQDPPPPRRKSIAQQVSPYYKAAKMVYKLMRAGGYIEFFVVSEDVTGKPKYTSTHTVRLTADELDHLDRGGKIVVAHACGYEAHVKV